VTVDIATPISKYKIALFMKFCPIEKCYHRHHKLSMHKIKYILLLLKKRYNIVALILYRRDL